MTKALSVGPGSPPPRRSSLLPRLPRMKRRATSLLPTRRLSASDSTTFPSVARLRSPPLAATKLARSQSVSAAFLARAGRESTAP